MSVQTVRKKSTDEKRDDHDGAVRISANGLVSKTLPEIKDDNQTQFKVLGAVIESKEGKSDCCGRNRDDDSPQRSPLQLQSNQEVQKRQKCTHPVPIYVYRLIVELKLSK